MKECDVTLCKTKALPQNYDVNNFTDHFFTPKFRKCFKKEKKRKKGCQLLHGFYCKFITLNTFQYLKDESK